MKLVQAVVVVGTLFIAAGASAEMQEFDGEKMLSDLEKQLELSSEELSKLKPALDAKSEELKKSIHESVDRGFVELQALSQQLDSATKEAEVKLREALSSEEMQQLKEYLKKIDKDAINQVQEELVAQLTALLKLTESQLAKIKPALEESFGRLSEILEELAREGSKNLEEFKRQYEELNKDLRQKLEGVLDGEQIKSLDLHREELNEKIQASLFST